MNPILTLRVGLREDQGKVEGTGAFHSFKYFILNNGLPAVAIANMMVWLLG